MDTIKKGLTNKLTCDVCKIDFNSNADYALHEFSKKHCDNLIRLAKQKPIISKQKVKSETSQVEKDQPRINSVTHAGSFAKYGYFVPGEIYVSAETSKEFNTDYDPYLQKFAENPFKEKLNPPTTTDASTYSSITSFSRKKKKKIKTCQVCNVTLSTVPEYEAHMKSPQHIWKLKVTGMGVSAHFVKASTDLHTTDINEEPKPNYQAEDQTPVGVLATAENENQPSGPFPLLYCSDCELLLNSPQQYNAHINGKLHIECAHRKAELKAKKEKLENPSPNQLYCYSCKISLNNLFQYNEHKNGKKHKTKCKNLIRKGITIPPEERVPGIPLQNSNRPVVYPELYEKLVLEKQKNIDSGQVSEKNVGGGNAGTTLSGNYQTENSEVSFSENICNSLKADEGLQSDAAIHEAEGSKMPKIVFHQNCITPADPLSVNHIDQVPKQATSQQDGPNRMTESPESQDAEETGAKEESKRQVTIITDNTPLKCSICNDSFQWQSQLDFHLTTEYHLKKILELKQSGDGENEIINAIFTDRSVIKPSSAGKLSCSICSVTTDSDVEFEQHLNSIVHKYTQKDYRTKRTLEVKQMVGMNDQNLYFCKLCKEGWPTLVEYTQHLHFAKHKSIQRAQRAKMVLTKRRTLYLQKQRLMQCSKKRDLPLRRVKTEKNPGVRTKVCGVAIDLNSGTQAPVPNLEPLEPKIDITKNVSIGVCEKPNNEVPSNPVSKPKQPKSKKRCKIGRSNQQYNDAPPLMPPGVVIPPLMSGPPYHPPFPRPPPYRNWPPYSSPCPPVFGPYCGRPLMGNPYLRPPWFRRPPWPRYR